MELQLEFGDYYLVDKNDNTIATTDKIMLESLSKIINS